MARYALITSTLLKNVKPRVLIEDDKGVTSLLPKEDPHLERVKKQIKKVTFAEVLTGFSYYDIEVGDYSGEQKKRIDEIVKTGKLPQDEQDLIDLMLLRNTVRVDDSA